MATLGERLARRLLTWANGVMAKRPPDFVIGEAENPYMLRWWIIPRNPVFNVYLHRIKRSDDDRALHDHPWWNISFPLSGGYIEHLPLKGGTLAARSRVVQAGHLVARWGKSLHRLELRDINGDAVEATSLFITGPKFRNWGFACPKGWVRYQDFVSQRPGGAGVGKGCDQ